MSYGISWTSIGLLTEKSKEFNKNC